MSKMHSAFCHVRELGGLKSLTAGSKVSFIFEYDEKGGKAKQVIVEESVVATEQLREVRLAHASPYRVVQADLLCRMAPSRYRSPSNPYYLRVFPAMGAHPFLQRLIFLFIAMECG